jgi:hypothetical protein
MFSLFIMDTVSGAKITDDFQDSLIDMTTPRFHTVRTPDVKSFFWTNGFAAIFIKILVRQHVVCH